MRWPPCACQDSAKLVCLAFFPGPCPCLCPTEVPGQKNATQIAKKGRGQRHGGGRALNYEFHRDFAGYVS